MSNIPVFGATNSLASPSFGSPQPSQASSAFGSSTSTAAPFGQQNTVFGQNPGGFGTTQPSSMFGQTSQQPGAPAAFRPLFGQSAMSSSTTASTPNLQAPGFGQSTGLFQSASTPGFGQTPGMGQPGSTGLFPSTGTGQSTSAGAIPVASPLFGRPTTAPTSISSMAQAQPSFGQSSTVTSSGFGQSSTMSSSGFGQPATLQGSAFSQSSAPLFGQPAKTSFGQTSGQISTTPNPLFPSAPKAATLSSPFGTTSQSAFSTGGASLFSKGEATSTAQFGAHTTTQSSFPAPASTAGGLFGKSSSSSPAFTGTIPQTATSAFGKVSPVLFGKGPASQPASTSSQGQAASLAAENAFAKSTGFTPAANSDKLFGKSEPSSQGFAKFGTTGGGLFGKKDATSSGAPAVNTGLFGKPEKADTIKTEPTSVAFAANIAKSESPGFDTKPAGRPFKSENNSGLFGVKPEESKPSGAFKTEPQAGLFGKVKAESSGGGKPAAGSSATGETQGAGLFGKKREAGGPGETQGASLFGKARQEIGMAPRGRPRINRDQRAGPAPTSFKEVSQSSAQGRGLFGKPAPPGDAEGAESPPEEGAAARGRSGATDAAEGRVLFGKRVAAPARRLSRSGTEEREQQGPGQGGSGQGFRRQISEELSNKVAIICRNLGPARNNNTHVLRNHFRHYGEVTKVFPNPTKGQATVHFKTHEQAADAKRRGRQLGKGGPLMTIFWSSYSGPGTPRQQAGAGREPGRPGKRTSDETDQPRSKRISWQGDSEVDSELQGMTGTQDMTGEGRDSSPQPGTSRPALGGPASPGKRNRSASPAAPLVDVKGDKIHTGMFEGTVARTTTDKVQLLNLRDKYIRQYRKKKDTNISTAKAFLGTCPDMCPEKERYDREDKRRLCVYEMVPGSENIPGRNPLVDHSRAVKEYIRSSPDQDEPLPHELRPVAVLHKTMTFLLSQVADLGRDGHWENWFDYLWNRTRGIRKDITQQQLCDRVTVSLIEKCARFHVFCSARLCEEDMHTFDEKINNENLTKCLQTLKELYADLEKKQNCFCPTEPEFRSYTVLMNLNSGDILRQVQKLRPSVRASRDIRFATQAYFALNSNNYIRFFRLVKEARFGEACIMHRYFTQVRNKALLTMMRGYGMGNRPAQIPLSTLVHLLSFEDESEALEFCEYYGFNILDGEAILDRAEYIEPETAWPARRSRSLIESKLMLSVGEMINGEPFEDKTISEPTSSFDVNDRFHSAVPLPARTGAADVQRTVPTKPEPPAYPGESRQDSAPGGPSTSFQQQPQVAPPPYPQQQQQEVTLQPEPAVPQKMHFPTEYIKDTAKILFWEVINEMCGDLGREVAADVTFRLGYSAECTDSILQGTITDQVRSICEEVYAEEEEKRERALKQEREERRDRVAQEITDEITRSLVAQEALNLATIEIREILREQIRKEREVKAILRQQRIDRVTVDINADLVKEVYTEMVQEVAEDVFDTDVTQRLAELARLENVVKLSRAGRFLNIWRKNYTAVTKLKRAMQDFPSSANMECTSGQIQRLINVDDDRIIDKQFYVNKRAMLTIESPMDVESRGRRIEGQFTVHRLYQRLLQHTAWQPLDLSKVVGKILTRHGIGGRQTRGSPVNNSRDSHVYWKLLLCLPDTDNGSADNDDGRTTSQLCDWVVAKFSKGNTPPAGEHNKSKVISLYKSKLPLGTTSNTTTSSRQGREGSLRVCIRTVAGTLDQEDIDEAEEERILLGTSGLMFVLPAGNYNHPYWKEQRLRLQSILEVKPMSEDLPMVVIVPLSMDGVVNVRDVKKGLGLLDSHVEVVVLETGLVREQGIDVVNPVYSEQVCESLQWLAERASPPPTLSVSYLKDCVEKVLLEHYYTPTQHNLKKRRHLGYLDQDPNSLLDLYNGVIGHLADTLTAEALSAVSWPVPEFVSKSLDIPPAHWNSEDHFEYLYKLLDIPPAHWNSEDHFEYLYKLLGDLALPQFCLVDPDSEEWAHVKRDLWHYVSTVTGRAYGPARTALYSRLKKLLREVEEDFEETCYLQEGADNCQPTYINVPWSRVVSLCIDYRFDTTDFMDPDLMATEHDLGTSEMRVAYDESVLSEFTAPAEWRHIESEKSILETPTFEATVQRVVMKAREKNQPKPTQMEVSVVEDPHNISQVSVEAKTTSSTLITALQSERRSSDHFQKYLESALKTGEEGNQSFNASFESGSGLNSVFNPNNNLEFSVSENQRRVSFDATGYFNQSRNDISRIFDTTAVSHDPFSETASRRMSDVGGYGSSAHELTRLFGKKRKQRLSEIFRDDPVAVSLKQPSLSEDFDSFKENLKKTRRDSDLFDKRLQALLTKTPMDTL